MFCLCASFALEGHQTSSHANASLNFSYSGFDDPLLDYTVPVAFSIRYVDASNQTISNAMGSCQLNFTQPVSTQVTLNYSSVDERYWANLTYEEASLSNQFYVSCENSANASQNIIFSDESGPVAFEYDVFAPIIIDVFSENQIAGLYSENRSIISGLSHPIYLLVRNITGMGTGQNVTDGACVVEMGNVNTSAQTGGYGEYFLAQPIMRDVGDVSYRGVCSINGTEYVSPNVSVSSSPLLTDSRLFTESALGLGFGRQPILLLENGSSSFVVYNPYTDTLRTVMERLYPGVEQLLSYAHTTTRPGIGVGDLDSSGGLSLLYSGEGSNPANLFQFASDAFSQQVAIATLQNLRRPASVLFDANNDGFPDMVVAGQATGSAPYTRLLRNNGTGLVNVSSSLPNLRDASLCYGDFNEDTRYDLFVSGYNGSEAVTALYINNGSDFLFNRTITPALHKSACAVGRFLGNNQTQLLHFGTNDSDSEDDWQYIVYADLQNLSDVWNGSLPGFTGPIYGDAIAADFTNDGYTDLLICGGGSGNGELHFFVNDLNNSGGFLAATVFNQSYDLAECALSAADYDFDGGLDLALTGLGNGNPIRLFNNAAVNVSANVAPEPPQAVSAFWNGSSGELFINWSMGQDNETDASDLSYNLEVRTQSGDLLLSGQPAVTSKPAQGYLGNMQFRRNYTLREVTEGNLHIRIQSLDAGLRKSDWTQISLYTDACQPVLNWTISAPTGCLLTEALDDNANVTISNGSSLTVASGLSSGTNTLIRVINGTLNLTGVFLNGSRSLISVEQDGELLADNAVLDGINLSLGASTTLTALRMIDANVSATTTITLIDSRLASFDSNTSALFINVTWSTLNVSTPVEARYYLDLTFVDQFSVSTANVTAFNGTHAFANSSRLNLTAFYANGSVNLTQEQNLTFSRSGYYNASLGMNLTGNANQTVTILRTPVPISGVYDVSGLPAENLSGNYSADVAAYSSVSNLIISQSSRGRIQFLEPANVSFVNFSQVVYLEPLLIGIDSVSADGLNRTANLTFYNVSFSAEPAVLRDGDLCSDCNLTRFNGSEADVTVAGFSNYSLVNNSVLSLNSSSVFFNGTEANLSVRYHAYGNASKLIAGATCNVTLSNDSVTRVLIEESGGYTAPLLFTAIGSVNATARCDDNSSYEPQHHTFELQVVRDGVYLLRSGEYSGMQYTASVFGNLSGGNRFWITGAQDIAVTQAVAVSIPDGFPINDAYTDASAAIADLNNDGWEDLIVLSDSTFAWYDNLTNKAALDTELSDGALAVLDYDFDGDLDLLACGLNASAQPQTVLLQNQLADQDYQSGTNFSSMAHNLTHVKDCLITISPKVDGHYVVIGGTNSSGEINIWIYDFSESITDLGSIAGWRFPGTAINLVDVNADALADLVSLGYHTSNYNTTVYLGNGSAFVRDATLSSQLKQFARHGSAVLGRLTNASDQSLILSGQTSSGFTVAAYGYNGSDFVAQDTALDVPGTIYGGMLLGDIDGDSDLDLVQSGLGDDGLLTHLYENTLAQYSGADQAPQEPAAVSAAYTNGTLAINWSAGEDNETPSSLLTYSVRVGSTAEANHFVSGVRGAFSRPYQPHRGNVGSQTTINRSLSDACITVQVQTIDSAYQASPWSDALYANNHTEICNGYDNDCDGLTDEDFLYPGTDLFIYNGSVNGTPFVCEFHETYAVERLSCPNAPASAPGDSCLTNQYDGAVYAWNATTKTCGCDTSSASLKNVQVSTQRGTGGGGFGGSVPGEAEPVEEVATEEEPGEAPSSSSSSTASVEAVFGKVPGFEIFLSSSYRNGHTTVTETIKNIERTEKSSIVVRKDFPKDVLASASRLRSLNEFIVIEEDPVVDFSIKNLDYLDSATLVYSLPGELSEAELARIVTSIRSQEALSEEEVEAREEQAEQKAGDSLQINVSELREGNQTVIRLNLSLLENVSLVSGVEIEQEIPKCLIEVITDTILESAIDPALLNSVQIKEADPIIVWNFKQLDAGQTLDLRLDALREEDCDDETKIRALAEDFIRTNQPINNRNLLYTLLLTLGTLGVALLPLVLARRHGFARHGNEHVLGLAHAILKRRHLDESDADIRRHLLANCETQEDIAAAFAHIETHAPSQATYHLLEKRVEIAIFFMLLVLSGLELAGLLPGYLDWMKKVISWVIMLMALYHANLSRIFFNYPSRKLNAALLTGMFLMHLKNLVEFAQGGLIENIGFVYDAYAWILRQESFFTVWLFLIGAGLLAICSVYVAWRLPVRDGCLFGMLAGKVSAHTVSKRAVRTILAFGLFIIFFFTVFNRLLEWLAIAVDSAIFVLTVTALLLAVFSSFLRPHGKRRSLLKSVEAFCSHHVFLLACLAMLALAFVGPLMPQLWVNIAWTVIGISLLVVTAFVLFEDRREHFEHAEHVTVALDSLYEKFLKLFKYPATLPLALSGVLVLQQVVEIGLFIVPNITGESSLLYGESHGLPLFNLFGRASLVAQQLFPLNLSEQIVYGALYVISLLGVALLFAIPVYVWVVYFRHRKVSLSHLDLTEAIEEGHGWLGAAGRHLRIWGAPVLVTGVLTQVFSIQTAPGEASVGLILSTSALTLSPLQAWLLLGGCLAIIMGFAVASRFGRMRRDLLELTLWTGILLNSLIYLTPYLATVIAYLEELIASLGALSPTAVVVSLLVVAGWGIDLLIVYALGGLVLVYLATPTAVKERISGWLVEAPLIGHAFDASAGRHLLEYYDDARHHLSGNLLHHLEHYARREMSYGLGLTSILARMRAHGYPELMVLRVAENIQSISGHQTGKVF